MTTALSLDVQEAQLAFQQRQFEFLQRQALMLSKSDFVPDAFKNNVANCALIVEMASRLNTDAFLVSRQIYMVHNKPSFSSKFTIALLNRSGYIRGRLKFKKIGKAGEDSYGMYAIATDAETGEELEGPEVTIAMAKKEGWYTKNGSKWPSLPDLMLSYRAASFFIGLYYPEILAGFSNTEEVFDSIEHEVQAEVVRQPRPEKKPRESETVIIDGNEVDTSSGEIVGTAETKQVSQEENGDLFDQSGSPAFTAGHKKLLATENAEQVRILLKSTLLTKMSQTERSTLAKMCEERIKQLGGADHAPEVEAQG